MTATYLALAEIGKSYFYRHASSSASAARRSSQPPPLRPDARVRRLLRRSE
jgi:hypothetical protein